MIIGRIAGATRELGKPANWNAERDGECGSLAILDVTAEGGHNVMMSAWYPTPDEVARIAAGEPVYLSIWGVMHPPVMLSVAP
jgi:hypothetical protein